MEQEKNLFTWRDEFLTKTDFEKWVGMKKENLEKHNCEMDHNGDITDGKYIFLVNSDSCMLCKVYRNMNADFAENRCLDCPLFISGNGCEQKGDTPWKDYLVTNNVEPLIRALEEIKPDLPQRTNEVNKIEEGSNGPF